MLQLWRTGGFRDAVSFVICSPFHYRPVELIASAGRAPSNNFVFCLMSTETETETGARRDARHQRTRRRDRRHLVTQHGHQGRQLIQRQTEQVQRSTAIPHKYPGTAYSVAYHDAKCRLRAVVRYSGFVSPTAVSLHVGCQADPCSQACMCPVLFYPAKVHLNPNMYVVVDVSWLIPAASIDTDYLALCVSPVATPSVMVTTATLPYLAI